MIKKYKIFLIAAALCVFVGCGEKIKNAKESAVTADEKGTITQVLVEEFPAVQYDVKDLETTIHNLIEEYNQKAGLGRISLVSFDVKDDIAKAILSYNSDEDYRGFNQVDFFAGDIEQALKEGYVFAGDFADAKDNDFEGQEVLSKAKGQKVMIIREPLQVWISGKILYVSKNMEVLSKNKAKMISADDSSDAVTEAFGYVVYEED